MNKKSDVMTLKPGLLVSLKTTKRGGTEYAREDLASKKEGAAKIDEWKTTKKVTDPKEDDRAAKLRSKLGGLVRKVCVPSAFGLICPVSKETELREAIAEAKVGAAKFNTEARTVQIGVFCLVGRIAETDQEATRAIRDELRDMIAEMQGFIEAGAVEKARDSASKLLKMGMVLDEKTQGKVKRAVEEVRQIAKDAIKKVTEGGVTTAEAVAGIKFKAVEEARFAFLDEGGEVVQSQAPATDARGLDDGDLVGEEISEGSESGRLGADGPDPSEVKAAASPDDNRALDV